MKSQKFIIFNEKLGNLIIDAQYKWASVSPDANISTTFFNEKEAQRFLASVQKDNQFKGTSRDLIQNAFVAEVI